MSSSIAGGCGIAALVAGLLLASGLAAAQGVAETATYRNARILAGALPNADNLSLQDYRAFVLQQSYPGASVDYAPMRENWFVLSGTRDGVMFYERVTFTCGGKLINSWAMLYPAAERRLYDRVVEQVSKSYRAGGGNCG